MVGVLSSFYVTEVSLLLPIFLKPWLCGVVPSEYRKEVGRVCFGVYTMIMTIQPKQKTR